MKQTLMIGLVLLATTTLFGAGVHAATITVDVETDGTGAPGVCELRDAIVAANTDLAVDGCVPGNGDDRIAFASGVSNIVLTANLPEITANLEINGRGQDVLTIDGNELFRSFSSPGLPTGAGQVIIRNLRLIRGFSTSGGGCLVLQNFSFALLEDMTIDDCHSEATGGGGGVFSSIDGSEAMLRRVTISNNLAELQAGGMSLAADVASIEDSTFSGNFAPNTGRRSGALAVGQSTVLTITRSTFWGNQASGGGSAMGTLGGPNEITIRHSTFTQNTSTGTSAAHDGGAIYSSATLTLENTVVAGNIEMNPNNDNADVMNDGGVLNSGGYNFIGNNSGSEATFPAGVQPNGDQVGTPGAPLDPELGSLANNGGNTQTALPGPASPLLDQGSCPGEEFDQRGFGNADTGLRPVLAGGGITPADDGCDTGAAEAFSVQLVPFLQDGFETP